MDQKELFLRIPINAIMDRRIGRTALLLYGVLIDAADELGVVQGMTVAMMAMRCNVSEKTIRRAEHQLAAAGYIWIEPTGRASEIYVTHSLNPMKKSAIEEFRRLECKAFLEKEGIA